MGLPPKVLVIDDHPGMGTSLRLMLSPEHAVEVAATADAALRLLEQAAFDLILCDVIMPGMNGLELHARIRELNPEQAEKFVLMTGGATSPTMAAQISGSGLRVLEKPFAPEVLRAMLREATA